MSLMHTLFLNTLQYRLDMVTVQSDKRSLRAALSNQKVDKIRGLLEDGISAGMIIDEVFWDTPLTFAVKHGFLEVVEMLVSSSDCSINYRDRSGHTALDEAVRVWLTGSSSMTNKQQKGRRFRILRCLLTAGATDITIAYVENLIFSCYNSKSGIGAIDKLVRVVCQKGHERVRNGLLVSLISYNKMEALLELLLQSGADIIEYVNELNMLCRKIPESNACLLIKATNRTEVLQFIEQRVSPLRCIQPPGHIQAECIKLLIISGHCLSPCTLMALYKHRATLYRRAVDVVYQPRLLRDISRVIVRQNLHPNVIYAVTRLSGVPRQLKKFLLFQEL